MKILELFRQWGFSAKLNPPQIKNNPVFTLLPWTGLIICLGYIFLSLSFVTPVQAGSPSLDVPELDLEISDSPDPVKIGQMLTYAITATNTGAADATNVIITSILDSNVNFVSADNGGAFAAGVVTWNNLGTLVPGASVTVNVTVTVISVPEKLLVNTAKVLSDEGATDCESETTLVIAPELVLEKRSSPAEPGEVMTYTIVVTNVGNADATNVVISDDLPLEVTFQSASDGGVHDGVNPNGMVTWPAIASLLPWEAVTRTLTVLVQDDLDCGTPITNTARAVAAEGVMAEDTITTSVQGGRITVLACEDKNADGACGPDEQPLPDGVQACLVDSEGQKTCQAVPAEFQAGSGVFTASLEFNGASQGYYPTIPSASVEILACEDKEITLPAVYPVHPKGIDIHEGLNKVYVAFQGPKVKINGGDDNDLNNYDWPYPFVAVINGETDQVIRTIPDGVDGISRKPWGVGVSGDKVYVGSGTGKITIIDANTDNVLANIDPGRPAKFTSPVVNPDNGWVYFPDRLGYLTIVDDMTIIYDLKIEKVTADELIQTPFELAVAQENPNGHPFVAFRDALEFPNTLNPFKFGGVDINPFGVTYHDVLESDGSTTGSPHAVGLWPSGPNGQSRLYMTYTDDDPRLHFGDPTYFPNPSKLLVYQFPPDNPQNITRIGEFDLGARDFAEVGLAYNLKTGDQMVGTYAGFAYDLGNGRSDADACNSGLRGGIYTLNFDGNPADGFAPTRVVGNLPFTPPTGTLDWRNPFEIAVNGDNGKIYIADRCWNDFDQGGQAGGGAVLVFDPQAEAVNTNPASVKSGLYLPHISRP